MLGHSDGSVIIDINGNEEGFKQALSRAGKIAATAGRAIVSSLKAIGAAVGTVSAGITAVGAKIVGEFADYEQLVGGVETLFGAGGKSLEEYAESVGKTVDNVSEKYQKLISAQSAVMKNAENAYKTAGMSANEYMETVTGFAASLVSSLGGDTEKAAEYADMALTDMSDNANKMGTDMESLKNAYSGFSKSNFTMLDNLKLGYGGTKEEMQRLLEKAEELSGIKYDISSYADIVEAIHVIQEDMDIAETTAKEAEATISGSIGMLKAAFQNLLAGMGNAEADVQGLIDKVVEAFNTVVSNIAPIVDNIIAALPSAFAKISDALNDLLPDLLSTVIAAGLQLIENFADSLAENTGTVIEAAGTILTAFIDTIETLIPTLNTAAIDLLHGFCGFLKDNITDITDAAVNIIDEIANGIGKALPVLIPAAIDIIYKLVESIINNIDTILDAAEKIIQGLAEGLLDPKNIDTLLTKTGEIVVKIGNALVDAIPDVLDFTVKLLDKIADGLVHHDWGETVRETVNNLADAFDEALEGLADVAVKIDNIFNDGGAFGGNADFAADVIKGVTGGTDDLRAAGEKFADTVDEVASDIADHYDSGKEAIKEAIAYTPAELDTDMQKSVMNGYAENARNAALSVQKSTGETTTAVDELANATAETSNTFSTMGNTAKKTETAVKKSTDKISDDFKAYYNNLKLLKAKGEISDDEYIAQLKAKLNSSAEYSAAAYTSYWNEVTSAETRAADEAAKEEEQRRKELEQQREKAAKERLKQQQKTANAELAQFKTDTEKLTSEYKSKLSELQKERDSFKGKLSENIFDTETVTDKRTGKTKKRGGVVDLQKKITSRKALGKYLESLVKKGIPKGMLSELAAMDPDEGLQFAKQLDSMDIGKWQSLIADYNEYEAINEEIANRVYGPQITALNEKYAADMTSLLDTVTDGAAAAGAETVKEFIKGVDLSSDEALSVIEDKLNKVGEAIGSSISDGSLFGSIDTEPVGVSIAEGIANGIISQSDMLKNALEKALNSSDIMSRLTAAVDFKSSGYAPVSTSMVTNISNVTNNNRYMSAAQGGAGANSTTNLTVNLLWKDGTKLAEIVNTASKKIAISTGGN